MIGLNYRDARPLSQQVEEGLRRLMVTGAVQEGETLPSVSALATSLSLNPMAIRTAYDQLVQKGYVQTCAQGFLVLPRGDPAEPRRQTLLHQFDETVGELLCLGCTQEELCLRLKEVSV